MSRMPVVVRELAVPDGPALHTLWQPMLPHPVRDVGPDAYAEHVLGMIGGDADATVLVAEVDGSVAGAVYLTRSLAAPVGGAEALQVGLLAVAPGRTRRGVGRALMEAALARAEALGLENVLAASGPGDRETNRFLARLGLNQVVVVRGATVAALRARLRADPAPTGAVVRTPRRARQVGQVVAVRRTQRRIRGRQAAH